MTNFVYPLTHENAKRVGAQAVMRAPDGYELEIREPKRSTEQNKLLWPLLTCFAEQLQWPVNGQMTTITPDDYKNILTAAFRKETARLAIGLDGGVVMLGSRTSKFSKSQFSEFIEFLMFVAADRGVNLSADGRQS